MPESRGRFNRPERPAPSRCGTSALTRVHRGLPFPLGRAPIVKTNVTRIIAAVTQNRSSATLLGVGALALIGGLATGPAPGKAEAAEPAAKTVAAAPDAGKAAAAPKAAAAKKAPVLPTQKWLEHDFQYQPNYFYCGP